jgi:hypothetical protein
MAPGRLVLRVRADESLSPDEGVVVDSLDCTSLGRSAADFVVDLLRVVPSFPPLSVSVPLFFPFTLFNLTSPLSPFVVLILEG